MTSNVVNAKRRISHHSRERRKAAAQHRATVLNLGAQHMREIRYARTCHNLVVAKLEDEIAELTSTRGALRVLFYRLTRRADRIRK